MPDKFGDTPRFDGVSLCKSCRCAQIVKGVRFNDEVVLCRFGHSEPLKITFPVMSCTDYENRNQPMLWEMEKTAWRLLPGVKRSGAAGFLTPTEFQKAVKDGKASED